jgi:hypothetical protein
LVSGVGLITIAPLACGGRGTHLIASVLNQFITVPFRNIITKLP